MRKYLLPFSILLILFSGCGNETTVAHVSPSDSILYKDAKGNVLTIDDLKDFSGTIEYEILDDVEVNPEANRLHQEGRELAGQGKYEESVEKLKAAMALQPEWAYPPYDLAYTYSLMGDDSSALKYYEITDSLRPQGFFTCKTALWSLRAERDGKFPAGMYMTFMEIEWVNDDREKMAIAQMIVDSFPAYAPAWMELSHLRDDYFSRMDAIEAGLAANPDPETKGIMLINKAAIYYAQGMQEEAVEILGEIIFDPEATGSNRELAKTTLKTFF